MTNSPSRTELNLRLVGTHEYEAVECVELGDDIAAFVRPDGDWDLVLTLSGIALGYRSPDLATCEKAARRLEGEQLFFGDPDIQILFERAGGRTAFLSTINTIGRELRIC